MRKTVIAGVTGALLAGSAAMAAEPVTLTDTQMDGVTAGFTFAGGLAYNIGAFVGTAGPSVATATSSASGGGIDETKVTYEGNTGGSTFKYTSYTEGSGSAGSTASYGTLGGGVIYFGRMVGAGALIN